MKKIFTVLVILTVWVSASAVDMQAHMGTKEAQEAYSLYLNKQSSYYTGNYSYAQLCTLSGNDLFGALNALMGNTCNNGKSGFSYGNLRYAYKNVDKDLNISGNIIGYYDGATFSSTWDQGKTWNREHTWPQSKFKGSYSNGTSIPIGYDMQSVRPALTAQNSDRGNAAYGESGSYYDPNEISINNSLYVSTNLGSYRGDAARVILYDYIVYGKWGSYSNYLYDSNVNADLLTQVGTNSNSVFESIPVLLKWHMNDPVSLTEMVRNDGAQDYQGNRNPFIDYPELAIEMLKNASGMKTYNVTVEGAPMWPNYRLTQNSGFIAYMGTKDKRPESVTVTGATYTYDKNNGRLIIKNVSGNMTISSVWDETTDGFEGVYEAPKAYKTIYNGQVVIIREGKKYNIMGQVVE